MGTPEYVSPEQATDARTADTRADIYSLGCTLFYLLAGRPPFQEETVVKLVLAHIEKEAPLLHELRSDVPPGLSAIVAQMLAKDPAHRYQTPVAVAQALVQFAKLGGKPAVGGALSPPQDVGSAAKATFMGADTSKLNAPAVDAALLSAKKKTAAHVAEEPFKDLERAPAAPFENLVAVPLPVRQGKQAHPAAKTAPAWYRRWAGGPHGWPVALVTAGILALVILGGVIVRVTTAKGTLVIESEDPSVEVIVKGQGGVTLRLGPDRREFNLKPGDYGIELVEPKAGLKLSTEQFTITNGGKETVKVWWEKKPPPPAITDALPPKFTNRLGMEFVLVPKGKSWLGGGGGRPGGKEVVIAHDFYLGKYEVTQEDWEKVTGLNPSRFSRAGDGRDRVKNIGDAELKRCPVEMVSWEECQGFIDRLNEKVKESGWAYRLPAEVEWEYACRGGPLSDGSDSAFDYYFDSPRNQLLPDDANFGKGWAGQPCRVGLYRPNPLGLYDMHGNVHQWCNDEAPHHTNAQDVDPSQRVLRGGSFYSPPDCCRAVTRFLESPSLRQSNVGLRVARVPVEKSAAALPIVKKADYDAIATGKWILVLEREIDLRDRMVFIPEQTAGDVIIRARVKKVTGQNLSISLRRDEKRGYVAWFNGGNWFGIYKTGVGPKGDLKQWHAPTNFDDYFEFAFSAVGETLTVYADGKRIGEIRDPDYRLGYLRIGATGGRSLFQDVEIMILDKSVPSTDEKGFVPLFNGKDLEGWHAFGGANVSWQVTDGTLTGSGAEGLLVTDRSDFENFRLRVEGMLGKGGDSGVLFRARDEPPGFAYEAQIGGGSFPWARNTGSLILFAKGGGELALAPKAVPTGQWFTMEILAEGNQFTIWVNGNKTVAYEDKKNPCSRGAIKLQALCPSAPVSFRKVEIKELPGSHAGNTPSRDGFLPLFNGKDKTGWKTHPKQPGDWHVENGILTSRGKPSHLFSDRGDFENFHLKAEARINKGGNSGLFFRSEFGVSSFTEHGSPLPSGYEAEIVGWDATGSLMEWGRGPACHAPVKNRLKDPNDWFLLEVIAIGDHIVILLNGQQAVDSRLPAGYRKRGHLALQHFSEQTVAEFRKIEIKELPLPSLETPKAEPAADGFVRLFNGKDLSGWHGMPHFDPYKLNAMKPEERTTQIAKWTEDAKKHWKVENGELVNDGKGAYLTTDKDFGDIEFFVEYKTVPQADSGIYLRATPQVQIWDWTKEGGKWDLGADKGSGGLWNNSPGSPGKDPLVLADKPFGEWNKFHIIQVGDITTVYLNEKLVVDHARLENFWNRNLPLLKRGPIQLQTHGGEIRWRNMLIREIPAGEAERRPPAVPAEDKGFMPLFNGKDLDGWVGSQGQPAPWRVLNGELEIVPGQGNIMTRESFGPDFQLHAEFNIPLYADRKGQARGNSGIFLLGRYEIQILDSYDNPQPPERACAALYGQIGPSRNVCKPPNEWQTYDITFHAPRLDASKKVVKRGELTVVHNGVVVLDKGAFDAPSAGGLSREVVTTGPILLQEHGSAIRFRNLTIKPLERAPASKPMEVLKPVLSTKTSEAGPATSAALKTSRVVPLQELTPEAKAARAFEMSCKHARETLLAGFGTALDELAKSTSSTDQRLKLIDAVKEEKQRFERAGLIPWSAPMQPFLAKYLSSIHEAQKRLHRDYISLIDAQLHAKNDGKVADLRADLKNLAGGKVVARWQRFLNGKLLGVDSLYANGKISQIDSPNTWSFSKGALIYRLPNPRAPGGAWIDTHKISRDGSNCAGTNQEGKVKITAVYVKEN